MLLANYYKLDLSFLQILNTPEDTESQNNGFPDLSGSEYLSAILTR